MFRAQSNIFDDVVVKATDENLTSENWEYILVRLSQSRACGGLVDGGRLSHAQGRISCHCHQMSRQVVRPRFADLNTAGCMRQGGLVRHGRQRCRRCHDQAIGAPQCERATVHAGARQRSQPKLRHTDAQGTCIAKLHRRHVAARERPEHTPGRQGQDTGAHGRVDGNVLTRPGSWHHGGGVHEAENPK
jgi:hypothetical protein